MSIASSTQKESYGSGRPPAQQRADRQDYKGPFLKPNVIPMNVRKFSDEKFWIEYERRIVEGDETKFGSYERAILSELDRRLFPV